MRRVFGQSKAVYKKKVFLIMGRPNHIFYNKVFNSVLTTLIFLNILAVILDTVPSLYKKYHYYFHQFEVISLVVFSVEYALRIWSCDFDPRFRGGIKGKLRFVASPMAVVDLLSILPAIIPHFFALDLLILRAVRLFRLIRLFKLARYSLAVRTLVRIIQYKAPELTVAFSFGLTLLVVSSSLMYYVEHAAQPEKFSSIPATMWWATATLTTVGYGDVYPITSLGKFLGAVIAISGVGLFALPAGIIASGLPEAMKGKLEQENLCPVCGNVDTREVEDSDEEILEAA